MGRKFISMLGQEQLCTSVERIACSRQTTAGELIANSEMAVCPIGSARIPHKKCSLARKAGQKRPPSLSISRREKRKLEERVVCEREYYVQFLASTPINT